MRTVSKKSQKLNSYLELNPSAKASAVAKLFKVSVQSVYQRKAKLKSAAPKPMTISKMRKQVESDWKLIETVTSNKPSTLVPNAVASMALFADDVVNHPSHYKVGGIETIDFIEAKQLDYHLGNVVKYISRADHKDEKLENLKKAQWYLNRAVANLSKT
jgi:hypothetical protein